MQAIENVVKYIVSAHVNKPPAWVTTACFLVLSPEVGRSSSGSACQTVG